MTKETDGVNTALEERKNGYRVLLTRARKGMVIFVPEGILNLETTLGIQSSTTEFLITYLNVEPRNYQTETCRPTFTSAQVGHHSPTCWVIRQTPS